MRLTSGVFGTISFCALIALSFGTSLGLTKLTSKIFDNMVALKNPARLFPSVIWLHSFESVAVFIALALQLVLIGDGPYVS